MNGRERANVELARIIVAGLGAFVALIAISVLAWNIFFR